MHLCEDITHGDAAGLVRVLEVVGVVSLGDGSSARPELLCGERLVVAEPVHKICEDLAQADAVVVCHCNVVLVRRACPA